MSKFERKISRVPQKKIDDVCELFVKYRGRELEKLAVEMRERGWEKFSQSVLHNKIHTRQPGWIQRLRLVELLSDEDREALNQRRTRRGFKTWLHWASPQLTWSLKFQTEICTQLDRVKRGDIKRLMLFLPPRHGKSEMVTVRYAVWRLLVEPETNIVIGSYNQRLANRFSLRAKRIAGGAGLKFGEARERLQRADEWETEAGGGVKAVGVGAGITGFGADLVIIDDPVKSREEAESANNRERIWDWYNDDICTRLEPEGAVILIQTRWHVDDLAGRLLQRAKNGGEQWDVISLPALAEDDDPIGRTEGDALWPKRFSATQLQQKRVQMGSYSFDALYQQRPIPRDGAHFKRSWFAGKVIDEAPRGLRWFRGYDLAVSTRTSADHTASFRIALDVKGNLYIADGFRKRIEFPEQRRYIIERIREERNTTHGIEAALHGKAFVQELMRDEGLVNRNFKAIRVDTDKFTRALSWQSRAEAGKVYLVRGPWNDAFLDELCSFPDGRHDDQVDAVSLAVQMAAQRPKGTYGF